MYIVTIEHMELKEVYSMPVYSLNDLREFEALMRAHDGVFELVSLRRCRLLSFDDFKAELKK